MEDIRLLIVQYAGDYREAFVQLAAGGDETYYAQKYSVDAVAGLSQLTAEVATLCCLTDQPYNELVTSRVRAIGAGFQDQINVRQLLQIIMDYNPTHLVLRTPIRRVLTWAIRHQITTLALFAESIPTHRFKDKIRNFILSHALNHPQVQWVGSYGLTASQSLCDIGVQPQKIIPWDFCVQDASQLFSTKHLRHEASTWRLLYIGSLCSGKGVGDLLTATSILKTAGWPIQLQIIGRDVDHYWADQVSQLHLNDCVAFSGVVPNHTVIPLMREADLVVVPSHHSYPEGFPLVITHALCARTPLIVSDHPMFGQHLHNQNNAMVFEAEKPESLAQSIQTILGSPGLYHQLSQASEQTWQNLQVPVKFADLLNRWLLDSDENKDWMHSFALSSDRYQR